MKRLLASVVAVAALGLAGCTSWQPQPVTCTAHWNAAHQLDVAECQYDSPTTTSTTPAPTVQAQS